MGNLLVIKGAILVGIGAVTLALFVKTFWLYALVFVLTGFFLNGTSIGYYNYIMELGTEQQRPLFLSTQGTMLLPVHFYPFLGGILADSYGYQAIFLISLAMLMVSTFLTQWLCEPRAKEAKCVTITNDVP